MASMLDFVMSWKKKLPQTGFFRLPQIIGDKDAKPPIPPLIPNASPVFSRVIDKYFNGKPDTKTLALLGNC